MARMWPVFITISACALLILLYSVSRQFHTSIPWTPPSIVQIPWHRQSPVNGIYAAHLSTADAMSNMVDILNRTLGFQEIQMISMPERTDKRDSFAVTASVSGIDFNITDGVDGEQISTKALPYTMQQAPKVLGCWRAHLDVWQDMIHRGVSSTLIFEDDADWDIGIRAQMIELAKGSRYALGSEEGSSPYGDDWDILWIGHCGSSPAPWTTRRFVIPDDPTVEPPESRDYVGVPNMHNYERHWGNSTRVVYPAIGGVCTASYAISLKGARKALYHTSMVPYNSPIDWGLNNICTNREIGFNCVSVFPSIIGLYRPAGNTSRNSDIGYGNPADAGIDEEGHSMRLAFSTRANLEQLFRGDADLKSAYPATTGDTMRLEDIIRAKGMAFDVPLSEQYGRLSNDAYKILHWDHSDVNLE